MHHSLAAFGGLDSAPKVTWDAAEDLPLVPLVSICVTQDILPFYKGKYFLFHFLFYVQYIPKPECLRPIITWITFAMVIYENFFKKEIDNSTCQTPQS